MYVCCVTDDVYYKACNYIIINLTIIEVCRLLILEMSLVRFSNNFIQLDQEL